MEGVNAFGQNLIFWICRGLGRTSGAIPIIRSMACEAPRVEASRAPDGVMGH